MVMSTFKSFPLSVRIRPWWELDVHIVNSQNFLLWKIIVKIQIKILFKWKKIFQEYGNKSGSKSERYLSTCNIVSKSCNGFSDGLCNTKSLQTIYESECLHQSIQFPLLHLYTFLNLHAMENIRKLECYGKY